MKNVFSKYISLDRQDAIGFWGWNFKVRSDTFNQIFLFESSSNISNTSFLQQLSQKLNEKDIWVDK